MPPEAASKLQPAESSRTRVMVVDDSAVMRGIMARWIGEVDDFDVVTTAANGRIAVDALKRFSPDIVLLDIEMPEMDGLAALPLILKRRPEARIIIVSTLTRRNAEISLKCLSLGAVDYLTKPDSRQVSRSEEFRRELIEKLKAHAGLQGQGGRGIVKTARRPAGSAGKPSISRPKCLLIGASTGGPRAVEQVLTGLGTALKQVPVLIVQHMPPMFTTVFADHLSNQCGARAHEPKDGEPLMPGAVFVAPGGRHMGLSLDGGQPVIRLDDSPPVSFCRPAVDVLLRDAAAVFGNSALAVILTGMGSDGTNGARMLVEAGGTVLVQDEATSTVWGMPGSVARAGLAHDILPLEAIGPVLKRHISGAIP